MSFAQQCVGVLLQLSALGILGADVQKTHPGIGNTHGLLCVHGSHQTELQQKLRGALGIGAAVTDNHLTAGLGGHGGSHGCPADTLDPLDNQCSAAEQGAGGAGGDKGVALALGEHPQADHHGGILLFPDHVGRIVVHIHHFVRMGDLHSCRQIFDIMLLQHFQNLLTPANQSDLRAVSLCRFNGTQHRCFGGKIAAHCVENDLHMSHLFL